MQFFISFISLNALNHNTWLNAVHIPSLPLAMKSWLIPPKQLWIVKWPWVTPWNFRTRHRSWRSQRWTPCVATLSTAKRSERFTEKAITGWSSCSLQQYPTNSTIMKIISSCWGLNMLYHNFYFDVCTILYNLLSRPTKVVHLLVWIIKCYTMFNWMQATFFPLKFSV